MDETGITFNVYGSVHRKNIPIHIQHDATLHSLLYLETALHFFRVVPPPIIRSACNCIYSIWYLSHRYSYLPLSWKSSNSSTTSGNCSTFFGWYLHPSSGAHATVSTASHICHTVTATCRYRGRVPTLPR